jgi:predicted negative regulator of RcsB-dependent stress response
MGPMFTRFSHHGQQRILLTQGRAYSRMGQTDKAHACFEEAWKVNQESVEAALIQAELEKLKAK